MMTPKELTIQAKEDPYRVDEIQALGMGILALNLYRDELKEAGEQRKINNAIGVLKKLQKEFDSVGMI